MMRQPYYNLSRGWLSKWSLVSIRWHIRQLLPLTYRSHYLSGNENIPRFAVWQMWFGRVFNLEDVAIDSQNS